MAVTAEPRPRTLTLQRQVVESALPVFSTHGYDAVSVEMLRTAARVSVGSLYHHFGSKAGVAAAVYAEAVRRYQQPLLEVVASDPAAETGVRSLVEAHHRWVAGHTDWARFMITMGDLAEIRAEAADRAAANARLVAAVTGWADPHVRSGAIVALEPLALLSVLFGPSYFHTRASLTGSTAAPDPAVAGPLADAAWRSLRGPGTPPT